VPSTPKRETKASSLSTGKTKSGRSVRFGASTTGDFRGSSKLSYNGDVKKPAFPLEAFMWAGRGASQWVVLPLVLMVVGLFRWAAGFWGYSGEFCLLNSAMAEAWRRGWIGHGRGKWGIGNGWEYLLMDDE
jgi:hypothetical protein